MGNCNGNALFCDKPRPGGVICHRNSPFYDKQYPVAAKCHKNAPNCDKSQLATVNCHKLAANCDKSRLAGAKCHRIARICDNPHLGTTKCHKLAANGDVQRSVAPVAFRGTRNCPRHPWPPGASPLRILRICRAAVPCVAFVFLVEDVHALLEGVNLFLKAPDAFEILGPLQIC